MDTEDAPCEKTVPPSSLRCLIIGAGISGILAVIQLRKAGFTNLVVYEKSNQIGGTWRDNTYPGLRCDIPAHLFTYSFEPNPEYSTRFPSGSEIQDYLLRVCKKHDVFSAIRFSRRVQGVTLINGVWMVESSDGCVEAFDVIINATGVLQNPSFPNIPGKETFQGRSFHSSRWDHSIDWSQSRVGVIGTGATAVQIVPELAGAGKSLVVFQRTSHWIFPMPNKVYSESQKTRLRENMSLAGRLRWRYGKIFQWTFGRAVIGNRFLLWVFKAFCVSHLKRKVHDAELRQKLTPNYRAGCKRLIFAKGYYQAIQKPNVTLESKPIQHIDGQGVLCEDGTRHDLDVLVYATGFRAHDYMRPMQLRGEDGISIETVWKQGAFAYRSTMIPGFPNYFLMFGPYSPIGNYSAISVAEVQVGFIIQLLQSMLARNAKQIAPCPKATDSLTAKMKRALINTVWTSGCQSWYLDELGNITMWPWTFEKFEKEMKLVRMEELRYKN
jgi:cation diffusion facilitator CzcD-associated flavoprotein CzcO